MNTTLAFVARLFLAAIFLISGVRKIIGYPGVAEALAGKGFPAAEVFGALTIALEIGAGLMLVVNWHARWAAAALAAFTLVAGILFHDFWTRFGGPQGELINQLNHFLKNVAIVGGLLMVTASRAPSEEAKARE